MPGKFIRLLLPLLALIAAAGAAACGTVATPEWAAEAQATRVAQAATSDHLTAIAPTATLIPPTATPVPATATPVPPTATPIPPSATPIPPTAVPPTAAATQEVLDVSGLSDADAIAKALAAGNADNGKVIFTTTHNTATGTYACATCHSVDANQTRIIGPGLWDVASVAGTYVAGENAVQYIQQSILDPNAFIAPGNPPFPPNLMPQDWGKILSPQDLNDVIAYLLTLHN